MNDYTTQKDDYQMTPEEAKASLGQATALVDQLLAAQAPQQGLQQVQQSETQEPMDEPQQEEQDEPEDDIQSEIADIRSQLSQLLEEEQKDGEVRDMVEEQGKKIDEINDKL